MLWSGRRVKASSGQVSHAWVRCGSRGSVGCGKVWFLQAGLGSAGSGWSVLGQVSLGPVWFGRRAMASWIEVSRGRLERGSAGMSCQGEFRYIAVRLAGKARLGLLRRVSARYGLARQARLGSLWLVVARRGAVWQAWIRKEKRYGLQAGRKISVAVRQLPGLG